MRTSRVTKFECVLLKTHELATKRRQQEELKEKQFLEDFNECKELNEDDERSENGEKEPKEVDEQEKAVE